MNINSIIEKFLVIDDPYVKFSIDDFEICYSIGWKYAGDKNKRVLDKDTIFDHILKVIHYKNNYYHDSFIYIIVKDGIICEIDIGGEEAGSPSYFKSIGHKRKIYIDYWNDIASVDKHLNILQSEMPIPMHDITLQII